MKTYALAAILWLGATQTVSFSNCCKGLLCSQKDNCPPCGSTSEESRSCCDGETSSEGRTGDTPCVHIEPASDVVTDSAPPILEEVSFFLLASPVDLFMDWVVAGDPRSAWGADPPKRPAQSASIYLADRDLRI